MLGYSVGYSTGSVPAGSQRVATKVQVTRVELLGRYSRWTYWKKGTDRIFRHTLRKRTNPTPALPHRVRKLTDDEVARLVEAYQAGATVYGLAEQFVIHRTTVSLHLKRTGVVLRQRSLREDQVATAASLYQQGWSLARLGEKFDVHPTTVHTALRRAGVPLRKPWERG